MKLTTPARTLLSLALAIPTLAAQATQPTTRPGGPAKVGNLVVAMVGDRAILLSTLEEAVDAMLSHYPPDERRSRRPEAMNQQLIEIFKREALAQGSHALTSEMREEVERNVKAIVEEKEREQIESIGSSAQFAAELDALGKSWEAERERYASEARRELNLQIEIYRRFKDQSALIVTPKEIREFYLAHIDEFMRTGTADVAYLLFEPEPTESAEAFGARVRVAAKQWAEPGSDPAVIKRELRATVTDVFTNVSNQANDSRREAIKRFAESAQLGEVSPPTQLDPGSRTVWLLKIVAKLPGRNDAFDSARVQSTILRQLATQRIRELERKLLLSNERTLHYWPSILGKR